MECCSPTPSKQKSVSWAVIGVSLAAIFVLWISGLIWAGVRLREQAMFEGAIESIVGIEINTPYRNGREVIEFGRIVPGGAADKSGLRRGDILAVEYHSVARFLRSMAKSQGDDIVIPVIRDGERIEIVLHVPLMPIHEYDGDAP